MTYQFEVEARNAYGYSDYSNIVSILNRSVSIKVTLIPRNRSLNLGVTLVSQQNRSLNIGVTLLPRKIGVYI